MNDYTQQLKKLMPSGRVFDLSSESNLTKLLAGLASELTLVDTTAGTIPDELNPSSTNYMIEEWLQTAVSDDLCNDYDDSIAGKRQAILGNLLATGGASKKYYQDVAFALGFPIKITDKLIPFKAGYGKAGESIFGDGWVYAFIVNAPEQTARYFKAGYNKAGDSLVYYGNNLLECTFDRIKQAHTTPVFVYSTESKELYSILNLVLNASGALKKVTTASGSGSGNLLANLGFGWNPNNSLNSSAWFDAEDFTTAGNISTWTDKVQGKDATNQITNSQPAVVINSQNSLPTVDFSTTQFLETNYSENLLTNKTLNYFIAGSATTAGQILKRNSYKLEAGTNTAMTVATESEANFDDEIVFTNKINNFGGSVVFNDEFLYFSTTGTDGVYKKDLVSGAETLLAADNATPFSYFINANYVYGFAGTIGGTNKTWWTYDGTNFNKYTDTIGSVSYNVDSAIIIGTTAYILDRTNDKIIKFDGTTITSLYTSGTHINSNLTENNGIIYFSETGAIKQIDTATDTVSTVVADAALYELRNILYANGAIYYTNYGNANGNFIGNTVLGVSNQIATNIAPSVHGSPFLLNGFVHFTPFASQNFLKIKVNANNVFTLDDTERYLSGYLPIGAMKIYNNKIYMVYNGDLAVRKNQKYLANTQDTDLKIYHFAMDSNSLKIKINAVEVANLNLNLVRKTLEDATGNFDLIPENYLELGTLIEIINAIDNIVTFSTNTATINITNDLVANRTYDVVVTADFASGSTETIDTWSFET